jgi:hypothetical protein
MGARLAAHPFLCSRLRDAESSCYSKNNVWWEMIAREIQIEQLFKGNVVYVSPSFHRPYAWVEGVCERILNALGAPDPEPLFMGALVTLDLGEKKPGYRKALLIDGNHRLLTLLMLMLALRDSLRPLDPKTADAINAACFINQLQNPTPILKNILTPRDRGVFEAVVLGTELPADRHPLDDVYRFGRDAFGRLDSDSLKELLDRLLHNDTFVELALAQDEDPYPVFKLFNTQDTAYTRIGLDAYTQFALDPELMEMIAGGESQEVEFKAHTIIAGRRQTDGSPVGVFSIIRAVAGFMNSTNGGTVLIGVDDDGRICGIESEYDEVDHGKSNWDGYQLFLSNMLRAKLESKNAFLHYAIERRTARQHDVCMIKVTPSDEPTYIEKHFYVRTNNQTVEMLGPDLVGYVTTRFPAI